MKILVLNCGSSSIKYQLIDMDNNAQVMAKGLLERIGLEMGEFTHKYHGEKHYEQLPIPNHTEGIKIVLNALTDPKMGVIKDLNEIGAVGNRVAHGGELFADSCLVNDEVIEKIKSLTDLAPLHTPGNLAGIYAMREVLPNVPQSVVFDTAFHSTLPPQSYLYGLPYEYYEKYGVRRYGFHGTSHKFVAEKAAKMIGKDWNDLKIISCHLGSGASICAIDHGKSYDTTMGMTPLEGLIMGSRPGDVDPGVMEFIIKKEIVENGKDWKDITATLNKKSGLLAIGGTGSGDMRDLCAAVKAGKKDAKEAFDLFAHRIVLYIGGYFALLGKVDGIVFAGGIGENSDEARKAICDRLGPAFGVKIDQKVNKATHGTLTKISTDDSKLPVWVIPTNEELMIARETFRIVSGR